MVATTNVRVHESCSKRHPSVAALGVAGAQQTHKKVAFMSELRIAVILGSTRPGRNGEAVAKWVIDQAAARDSASYELVDLAEYSLPFLDEALPASMGQYAGAHTKAWARVIGSFDAFVFVTPEYNHSVSGVLKNAIDFLYAEWNDKAAAFVGYGSVGGARSIEHLRGVASELQIAHVRQQLNFSLATDFRNYSEFHPAAHHTAQAQTMFGQLERWAAALKRVRADA